MFPVGRLLAQTVLPHIGYAGITLIAPLPVEKVSLRSITNKQLHG
jgi:hypothetical protein